MSFQTCLRQCQKIKTFLSVPHGIIIQFSYKIQTVAFAIRHISYFIVTYLRHSVASSDCVSLSMAGQVMCDSNMYNGIIVWG